MFSSMSQSLAWQFFVVLCAFTGMLDAYDLTKKRNPVAANSLKITLDYPMAISFPLDENGQPQLKAQVKRNFMWSSHITFPAPVNAIQDAQLWQIALDAFGEIDADMTQYTIQGAKNNKANALTVLAFGSEIILASTQRGPISFVYDYPESQVKKDLEMCQALWLTYGPDTATDKGHRTNGKCAEEMAAHLYYMKYGTTRLRDQNARIGTVVVVNGVAVPTDPCLATDEKFGCRQYMAFLGPTLLDNTIAPAPYDFATLFPTGPPIFDQIQSCGSIISYT